MPSIVGKCGPCSRLFGHIGMNTPSGMQELSSVQNVGYDDWAIGGESLCSFDKNAINQTGSRLYCRLANDSRSRNECLFLSSRSDRNPSCHRDQQLPIGGLIRKQ